VLPPSQRKQTTVNIRISTPSTIITRKTFRTKFSVAETTKDKSFNRAIMFVSFSLVYPKLTPTPQQVLYKVLKIK
jgi:hypothetical protein